MLFSHLSVLSSHRTGFNADDAGFHYAAHDGELTRGFRVYERVVRSQKHDTDVRYMRRFIFILEVLGKTTLAVPAARCACAGDVTAGVAVQRSVLKRHCASSPHLQHSS